MPQSNFLHTQNAFASHEMSRTSKRLIKEIMCLERQLTRLQQYNHNSKNSTCKTYEDMISSRYELLDSFGV